MIITSAATRRSPAQRAGACRLTGAESQAVFRALLAAAARPGTTQRLPASVTERLPGALAAVAALVDVGVSFHVLAGDASEWTTALATATGGTPAPLSEAWAIAALDAPDTETVSALQRGTALAPEHAARLMIQGLDACSTTVVMHGPGIDGERRVRLDGIDAATAAALAAVNTEFPTGVDTWLFSAGDVVAVPRSTRLTVIDRAEEI